MTLTVSYRGGGNEDIEIKRAYLIGDKSLYFERPEDKKGFGTSKNMTAIRSWEINDRSYDEQ